MLVAATLTITRTHGFGLEFGNITNITQNATANVYANANAKPNSCDWVELVELDSLDTDIFSCSAHTSTPEPSMKWLLVHTSSSDTAKPRATNNNYELHGTLRGAPSAHTQPQPQPQTQPQTQTQPQPQTQTHNPVRTLEFVFVLSLFVILWVKLDDVDRNLSELFELCYSNSTQFEAVALHLRRERDDANTNANADDDADDDVNADDDEDNDEEDADADADVDADADADASANADANILHFRAVLRRLNIARKEMIERLHKLGAETETCICDACAISACANDTCTVSASACAHDTSTRNVVNAGASANASVKYAS